MQSPLKALVARLSPIARASLEDGANRAFSRGHHEVEVEHVLLSLIEHSGSSFARALRSEGLDLPRFEVELGAALDRLHTGNMRNPVLSAWLPKWLERAWVISGAEYGEDRITSLHLLLALLADSELRASVQPSVPTLYSLDLARLTDRYGALSRVGGEGGSAVTNPRGSDELRDASAHDPNLPGGRTPALDKYTLDLTALARAKKIDPVIGRELEIRQIADVLLRRRQNNPILTGEPGVGKTAIVEGLALKIVAGEVPPALQKICLRTLDLGLLQAGASVKGEFENRLRQVVDEVKASSVPVVLFIDEAHTMIGAGGQAGQNDAANLLKPLLARGELRTIAATTWAEYKKYFEKDAALARRFQVVKVDEPSPELAVQMVRGIADAMADHHHVRIVNSAVTAAVNLSARYITGRQLPDKAVSVLDTACARVALSRPGRPAQVEDLEALRDNLDRELAALEREEGHVERIAELKVSRIELEEDLARLRTAWDRQKSLVEEIDRLNAGGEAAAAQGAERRTALLAKRNELRTLHKVLPLAFECVDESLIADVISGWTGIPLGRMVSDEISRVRRLADLLRERVIGQDHALEQIAERVQIAAAGLDDPGKPKGVFLLVGPSGVGKTETALALAEILHGGERNLITINMSEYQEAHSVAGLKGAPPGYVGYGEGGVLTEAVRRKPYSVVLLDEVEKAHPDVLELFFQVFDKGRLEDAEGREVDFRNTVILLTSNTGSELVMKAAEYGVTSAAGEATRDATPDDLVEILRPSLQATFKPAFLGRLVVVPYFPLGDSVLRQIVTLKLERIRRRIGDNHGAQVVFASGLTDLIAQRCYDADSGARDADAILTHTLLSTISDGLLERMAEGKPVRKIAVTIRNDALKVKLT